MTVSGLSPTFATAASTSVFDFLKRLRQWRANVLSETLTRRCVNFAEVDMTMGAVPVRMGKSPVRLSFRRGKGGQFMSALGQKQTCAVQEPMSALPPKATSNATYRDVG